ncbi:SDR family NAD(P)-dependent oxidoreductase [Microbacterium sp. No. 7]|uniref:SDR family NAD(P)-dependent oxidoreductase n=1 Tax=Microbacterium sp. No. 7 TaxID=1714373 RepID=UPI0006CFBE75|nr:SDR family oxidoreductase [Microbacterium sp. No. 7]ALJ18897.1 hypothetical protein AOA12_02820 [Microbacterium sp. No. 7]
MTGRLDGRIAVITGAASGQGAAEARLFAAEGAVVVLTDVDDARGAELARSIGGRAVYRHLDVTRVDEWADAAEHVSRDFGRLDVLVNNAGIGSPVAGRFDALPIEDHLRLFDVNVHGAYYGMRAMLPLLEESGRESGGGASIVNISSIDGLAGIAGVASYAAAKTALTGLTRSIAPELGPLGIRVNSIHPGVIRTPIVDASFADAARGARLRGTISRQAIARMGEPDEVAALALFLASAESSYCTGAQFTVDGGHLAGPYRDPVGY